MPFSDIIGHQRQIETLKRSLESDRLHHAYLFVGPEGVGKKTVALSLAMAVHCTEGDYDGCGRCQNCRRIQDGNHPDVRVVGPPVGKREIGIQQIRELERELAFRSFFGKRKVAIVDPAQLVNYPAQNALLKTLEEPPGNSLLVLIAESAGSLLLTLQSRCLRLFFGYPPKALAEELLVRRKGLSQDQAKLLVALTMGSLGTALAADASEHLEQRREWIERLVALPRGDFREAMALAEEVGGDGEECLRFLKCIEGWYRDVLICQAGGRAEDVRNVDLVEKIKDWGALCPMDRVLSALSRITLAVREVQRNYNRRLVLEDLLIGIVRLQGRPSLTASRHWS